MSAGQYKCECGCGRTEFFHKLKTLELEVAVDESLRHTRIGQRFFVRPECYDAFIHELQAKRVLDGIVRRYKQSRSGFFTRLPRMRNVIRLQYAINIRTKGIERTKRLSARSGLMFLAPHRAAGWLDNYWRAKDRRRQRKETMKTSEATKLVEEPPTTIAEAVDRIVTGLSDQDRDFIKKNSPSAVHFSAGMAMRNAWGLWKKDSPIKLDAIDKYKIAHADDISGLIHSWVWARVRGEDFDPVKHCDTFHEHWRKTSNMTSLEAGGVKG